MKEQPKPKPKKTLANSPAVPARYELADAAAIRALMDGTASPEQQKRALKWVVETAAGAYDFHYYPSDRDTAFALGRAFVGQQVVKMTKINVGALRRAENE